MKVFDDPCNQGNRGQCASCEHGKNHASNFVRCVFNYTTIKHHTTNEVFMVATFINPLSDTFLNAWHNGVSCLIKQEKTFRKKLWNEMNTAKDNDTQYLAKEVQGHWMCKLQSPSMPYTSHKMEGWFLHIRALDWPSSSLPAASQNLQIPSCPSTQW